MKRWKKILRNCPYLVVLLLTWLFITAGGVMLMLYRGYSGFDLKAFGANPFFAVIMEAEMNAGVRNEMLNDGNNGLINNKAKTAMSYQDTEENLAAGQNNSQGMPVNTAADNSQKNSHSGNGFNNIADKISDVMHDNMHGRTGKNQGSVSGNSVDGKEGETIGQTLFETYTPVETDSIYYSDAGKVALTTEYPYTKVEAQYFDDAVFFGDSRTLGISDYSGMNADFFCENGMTIYKLLDEKGVVNQKTESKENLNQVLQEKKYGKIYIMLGMNELGYGDTAYFLEQYRVLLEQLRQWQPEAIIYLQGNLHVSREKNNPDTEFNNININDKNAAIATLANGTDVFYLDINPLFTDDEGYLIADLTFDGVHLYADGYMAWRDFLMEHGVVK